MTKTIYNPRGLPSSDAPYYSQVVKAEGKRLVFISGQVALDGDGNVVGVGDFAAQAEKVFQNLGEALAAAGASFDDVAKVTIYLTDIRNRGELLKIRTKYFKRDPPASTLVQVVSLVRPELMLEIDAVAVID